MRERGFFFINGHWEMHSGPETFTSFSILPPDRVGSTLLADAAIVDRAVAAADAVRVDFEAMGVRARGDILRRAANLIDERTPDMAFTPAEQGKTVSDNIKEISFGAEVLRYYAEEGTRIYGSIRPASAPDIRNLVTSSGGCGEAL